MSEDLVGVVYALPHNMIERFFRGKSVFVKFVGGHVPTTRLVPGHQLYFYESHAIKSLVGEATIEKVEFLPSLEVIKEYSEQLFLTPVEVRQYVRRRDRDESKQLLVLHLNKIRRYDKPVAFPEPMTMAGRYMTEKLHDKVFQ